MSDFINVGKKSGFREDEGTAVTVNGKPVCIARAGDKVYAFDNRCTHAESQLSGGEVENGEILCPLHGARFSIQTGDALTLPAVKSVKTHQVKVEGDNVFVKITE